DFPAARRFGGDPGSTGISGATPRPGEAAITVDLARTLKLAPGGRFDIYAYGRRRSLIVDRILPRRGIAGFWLGSQQESRNVFVGVGLGRAIIAGAQRMFSTEHNRYDLFFTVRPASVAEGFLFGFAIALITVVAMSVRVSRLNIIRAIRDLPEPPRSPRRRSLVLGTVAIVTGVV